MITRKEILKGREKEYPLMKELEENLTTLLWRMNKLRELYKKAMIVTSGYRPGKYNKAPYTGKGDGAKDSAHLYCMAIDVADPDGELYKFCTKAILERVDLYMEQRDGTPTWCHLQTRKTKHRIFKK